MELIILARNDEPYETAPKVKLTFHPKPLILDCHIRVSEITGMFELKFHMEYNTIQQKKNNINILGHFTKMATMPIYGINN